MVDVIKMMRNLSLTFLVMVGVLGADTLGAKALGAKVPGEQELKKALGSPEFQIRRDATLEIWKAGDEALQILQNLAEGSDPEIAARAEHLALKIRSGLKPDTPQEVVDLVQRFFSSKATLRSKVAVLEELRRLERYEFIMRLRGLETDELVVERADEIVKEVLPDLVAKLTSEEKFNEVKELLMLGSDFPSMIAYANLLDQLGELDDQIEKLAGSEEVQNQQRYLACLRVKGDAALLLKEGKRLGDEQAVALASLVLGDHLPYFEYLRANRSLNLAARGYLDWTIAMEQGDLQEAERVQKSLEHLAGDEDEMDSARRYLFRMGFPELVLKGVGEDEVDYLYSYYLGQEQYSKILPLMGLKDGVLTEEWLNEQRRQLEAGDDGSRMGARLATVGSFFESRGMLDEAVRCCEVLVNAVRNDQEIKLSNWFAYVMSYSPKAGMKVLAKEVEDQGYDLSLAMEDIFRSPNFHWVFAQLEEVYPAKSVEEVLFLAASFGSVGRGSGQVLFVSEKEFEEAQDRVAEAVMESADKVGGIRKLLSMARSRDSERDLVRFGKLLDENGAERVPLTKAQIEVTRMRFKEAGKLFQQVEYEEGQANGYQLYYKGAALRKAGLPGGEELCRKGLLFSKGGSEDFLNFSRIEGQFHFDDAAYDFQMKALLRLDIAERDSSDLDNNYTILHALATGALKRRQWATAEAFWEAVAWEYGGSGAIYNLRKRFHILLASGARQMEAGDIVGAVRSLSRAHEIIPRDGYLANDFFPLLRDLGLIELHDQLFAISARECRVVIELYPGDDNAYNNFGWLASRANRCLDEAEEYLKKALALEPRSSAYLDTMGEIFFARRDREEAIKWSDLSRSYELSDVELQGQNLRFKHGEFPLR